ncbi:MlaD family protein [Nocardia sp. NBC_01009]|uniref:MlaD family protein n=1 Tax=Nocardia sp. NBC_01009 TaxID=2975996 RepID=UPI003866C8CD|nr:MlaD family protein [Nocardia sp. NBC_01009]
MKVSSVKPGSMASLGAIVAILLVGSTYLSLGVVRVGWLNEYTEATMVLTDSGGLLPRSKVLLSGIEIGTVTSVSHTGTTVSVQFRIDDRYRIPSSSMARIETLSGLGEPYLDFRPASGDGPYLRDGQIVDAAEVTMPISIPQVAQTATRLLNQLDPQAMAAIIQTFTEGLAGTETVVPQLSRATDLLAATLLARSDVIREMLIAFQANANDMAWSGPALTDASGPWAAFGPRVSEVAAAIARVIRKGNVPADYVIDTPETVGLVPFLRQLAERINAIGPDLATMIPLLQPLIPLATNAVRPLDIGSLITQALETTSPDGTLNLQLTVK